MKKKTLIVTIVLFGIITFSFYQKEVNPVIENQISKPILKDNLSMNFEIVSGSGEYQEIKGEWPTEDYIFNSELSKCVNGSEIIYDKENNKVLVSSITSDNCYVYFDKKTFATDIISLYTNGSNGLYYHDANLENGAGDNSYRYSGASPDNWVCFGTDATKCDNEHLYRIIGVFKEKNIETKKIENRVKIIKGDFAGESVLGFASEADGYIENYKGKLEKIPTYYWSGLGENQTNNWTSSTLNTEVLNGTYFALLGTNWTDIIATTEWKIGGNTYENIVSAVPKVAYKNEYVNPIADENGFTTHNAKIGLMYVSDYGFAASANNWTTILFNYKNELNTNNNWMFLGTNEWTITRRNGSSNSVYWIRFQGLIHNWISYKDEINTTDIRAKSSVRPTFYLNPDVKLIGGSGTESNPYRIS